MDDTDLPWTYQRPDLHDYQQIEAIYAHADSATTVGVPSRYTQAGGYARSWGRRVDGSWAEGHSTYWRSFGGGRTTITLVTWA